MAIVRLNPPEQSRCPSVDSRNVAASFGELAVQERRAATITLKFIVESAIHGRERCDFRPKNGSSG